MKISPLSGNYQMLDGGAMFGHVPRTIWSKWMQPNQNNQVKLACRCLLIQEKSRNILLETGIGAFFNPELRKRYGVEQEEHVLLKSLAQLGLTHYDIDIVILSHLHFDHAGGLLTKWEQGREHELLFPNAKYVVSRTAWDRACKPHVRDKASFIKELLGLLEQSSRIELIDKDKISFLGEQYIFHYTHGHTPGLLHTEICTAKERILFCSDLIPAIPWVHLPVTMGYDRSAEQLINEKKAFLLYAIKNSCILFYTHDPNVAFSGIEQDPLGKFIPINLL
ncbi:MAG: MBL fold metallo-hydrolase [Legionellales bacterium]|nr:MBL fold metallo-hydrolase [Legionellales bacterium]